MVTWKKWLGYCMVAMVCGTLPVWGESVPSLPAGLAPPTPALTMPEFQLPDVTRAMVSAADLRGKVLLVRFWATW